MKTRQGKIKKERENKPALKHNMRKCSKCNDNALQEPVEAARTNITGEASTAEANIHSSGG